MVEDGALDAKGLKELFANSAVLVEQIAKVASDAIRSESGKDLPGEQNLMELLGHFGKADEVKHFADEQKTGKLKYSELKEALAKDISEYFSEFREKKKELLAKPEYIKQVLDEGSSRARKVASATLKEVKGKIGLL